MSLGIFSVVPPTEPCALRSTQPLKVSTRDFSWGKVGRCVWLTTYHHCSAETSRKSGVLTYPETLGSRRPVTRDLYLMYYSDNMFRLATESSSGPYIQIQILKPLAPNSYMGRTAQLTSRCCILYIYSTNIRTEYFKHAEHSPYFSFQNAIYFITLPFLVPVLFTF